MITRFIEGQAVVTGYLECLCRTRDGIAGRRRHRIDGRHTGAGTGQASEPYHPASNQTTRLRDMARSFTRGACATARLTIRRPTGAAEVTAQRQPLANVDRQAGLTHDLPGEAFRLLSDQVSYLKLSVQVAQAAGYVERSKSTRGSIYDLRNYPSEFVPFALGTLLVDPVHSLRAIHEWRLQQSRSIPLARRAPHPDAAAAALLREGRGPRR